MGSFEPITQQTSRKPVLRNMPLLVWLLWPRDGLGVVEAGSRTSTRAWTSLEASEILLNDDESTSLLRPFLLFVSSFEKV